MTLATRTSHAGGLPLLRGSLRIVSAVQELATAHGEELELDGWDAEEGGHVGHQISGTSTCDIDNEDVRAKDVPKFLHWFLTDEVGVREYTFKTLRN